MWRKVTTQPALSFFQARSWMWFGCFLILGSFCMAQFACRQVKTGPKRVVLPHARDYLAWKTLTQKKSTSSHKGFPSGLIYLNQKAYPISNGDDKFNGSYPVGSEFVMIHYDDDQEKSPNAFVMRKMRNGYDPDNNNWRYSVVRLSDWTIEKDGRLVECIRCHQKQIARDYVPIMRKDFTTPTY